MTTLYRTGSSIASQNGVSAHAPSGYKFAMSMGKRITEARKAARLTQSELARRMDVKPQMVNQWERDKKGLSGRNLAKLAQALNANLAYLLYGKRDLREQAGNDILLASPYGGRKVALVSVDTIISRETIPDDAPRVQSRFPCSESAVAFTLLDESNAPQYPVGTIWIIDPGERPMPGDMVLATFGKAGSDHVCGVYSITATPAGRIVVVTPINTTWPAARSDLEKVDIVGVMTESTHGRRR